MIYSAIALKYLIKKRFPKLIIMSRFIKFRITKNRGSLEQIADKAASQPITTESGQGFEVCDLTNGRLCLRWIERITVPHRIADDVFGDIAYEETKLIRFELLFSGSSRSVILLNPPRGIQRVHKVLRLLFEEGNFTPETISVWHSVLTLADRPNWKVVAVQTNQTLVDEGVLMAISVAGRGQVLKFYSELGFKVDFVVKSALLDLELKNGMARVQIISSGSIKCSRDLSPSECWDLVKVLTFSEPDS